LRKLNRPVFLDSGDRENSHTIISGNPLETVNSSSDKDSLLELFSKTSVIPPPPTHFYKAPFTLGLIGFASYNFGENLILGDAIVKHLTKERGEAEFPDIYAGLFTWSLVEDIDSSIFYLTFSPLCDSRTRTEVSALIEQTQHIERLRSNKGIDSIDWHKSTTKSYHQEMLLKIKGYIEQGDCYQVNFTQQFKATANIDALDYYMDIRKRTKTPYSCFMEINQDTHLLSFSPEQFIGIDNRRIETKPIKGTIENNATESNLQTLVNSEKDRAENVMIVDLLRNDLSKVCQLHSVKVDKLFSLETFNNVHHLVSHISGKLKPSVSELDAFFSCFPGGSITGAPKKRSMEIIRELENSPRGAYCGSAFYLNHDGKFDSNILIRTITKCGNQLECWGGGGITSGSEPEQEYQESLIKVANITGIRS
jgi:para-aminobenzoate synthetase component 1